MGQVEQDWLELCGRVARSLHHQHRRNLRLVEAAAAEGAAEHDGVLLKAGLVLLVVELGCGFSTLLAAGWRADTWSVPRRRRL
jgi:hypothetical protein